MHPRQKQELPDRGLELRHLDGVPIPENAIEALSFILRLFARRDLPTILKPP